MQWWDKLLDQTFVFSFDRTGFKRHQKHLIFRETLKKPPSTCLVTGGSKGIGQSVVRFLLDHQATVYNLSRTPPPYKNPQFFFHSVDFTSLKQVMGFCQCPLPPLDAVILNAGSMFWKRETTIQNIEKTFASQVLHPFCLLRYLIDRKILKATARIIFVSSGGMYGQKFSLNKVFNPHKSYNRHKSYALAKKAQVLLMQKLTSYYPQYFWASMHPGWVDTFGVKTYMPWFYRLLKHRLRSTKEGADTILWLLCNQQAPNGFFWFDREQAPIDWFSFTKASSKTQEQLYDFCEKFYEKNAKSLQLF